MKTTTRYTGFVPILKGLFACATFLSSTPCQASTNWSQFTTGGTRENTELHLFRAENRTLHAVWSMHPSGGAASLMHRTKTANGGLLATPNTIVSGWNSLNNPSIVLGQNAVSQEFDGTLVVFFSGLRSTDITDVYSSGKLYSAQSSSAAGTSWTLAAPYNSDQNAHASTHISAARASSGSGPLETNVLYTGTGLFGKLFATIDTHIPGGHFENLSEGCCEHAPNMAVEGSGGDSVGEDASLMAGYYSSVVGKNGQYVRRLGRGPGDAADDPIYLPGSANADRSLSIPPSSRVSMTSRKNRDGIYVAWCAGYPDSKEVRVRRFRHGEYDPSTIHPSNRSGHTFSFEAPAGQTFRHAQVMDGSNGRLWIAWYVPQTRMITVVHTNRAANYSTVQQRIPLPPGMETVYRIVGDGSGGTGDPVALDLFVHGSLAGSNQIHTYTRQVRPQLSIEPRSIGERMARFLVADAGNPVPGARVNFNGRNATTNAQGIATIQFARDIPRAAATARATKTGYVDGTVRARGPR